MIAFNKFLIQPVDERCPEKQMLKDCYGSQTCVAEGASGLRHLRRDPPDYLNILNGGLRRGAAFADVLEGKAAELRDPVLDVDPTTGVEVGTSLVLGKIGVDVARALVDEAVFVFVGAGEGRNGAVQISDMLALLLPWQSRVKYCHPSAHWFFHQSERSARSYTRNQ